MSINRTLGRAAVLLLAALAWLVALIPGVAVAFDPLVAEGDDATMDYEVKPSSFQEESIVGNEVTFSFDTDGGPFEATAVLTLHHQWMNDPDCIFESVHEFVIRGTFDPATLEFEGEFEETFEATMPIADCEGIVFERTFSDQEGDWTALLNPMSGEIITLRHPDPLDLIVMVDPAQVTHLVPPTQPTTTLDPNSLTPGATPGGDAPSGGDSPTGDTPTGDAPNAGAPTGDTPPGDAPAAGDTPTGDTPTGDGTTGTTNGSGGGLGFVWIALLLALVLGIAFMFFRKFATASPTGPVPGADGGPAGSRTGSDTGGPEPIQAGDAEPGPGPGPFPPGSDVTPTGSGPLTGGMAAVPGTQGEEQGDCSELEEAWKSAKDACDEAERAADDLAEDFDGAAEALEKTQLERDRLPSEETRVELPDGSGSLSQLDLQLRREAAGAAWDQYMADPSPETARAAEEAWERQATPEWLEQKRAEHRAEKARLDEAIEDAQNQKDRLGRELSDARDAQQELCEKAAAARRKLDECLKAAAAARAEAERVARAAPPPEPEAAEPAPGEPEPVTTPAPAGAPDDKAGSCSDGDVEWRQVGEGQRFKVPTSDEIAISVGLIAGTRRFGYLGSLDDADFTILDDASGHAGSIFLFEFVDLQPAQIKDAFSGDGGLDAYWQVVGSGAVQRVTISLSLEVVEIHVKCLQKYLCVAGEWQPQSEWKTEQRRDDPESLDARMSFDGNEDAGFGKGEEGVLPQIVKMFTDSQPTVRRRLESQQQLEDFVSKCRQSGA